MSAGNPPSTPARPRAAPTALRTTFRPSFVIRLTYVPRNALYIRGEVLFGRITASNTIGRRSKGKVMKGRVGAGRQQQTRNKSHGPVVPRVETSSNQHLQIRGAFLRRFRGGRKIKKFVEESDLIPVAFMVMPGCVYSTIQFIFFLSLPAPYFFSAPKLSILRISFRTVLC